MKRELEVFTRTDAGTWILTDQTRADAVSLASIDCVLPMAQVFKGVADAAA